MKTMMISEGLYKSAQRLKRHQEKADKLFMDAALRNTPEVRCDDYLARCLAIEERCRVRMGIILGVCL